MANTPEAKVKQQVVKILKSMGAYYFFPATHGFGRSGVPDIVCCIEGRFVGIECKAGKNVPTALQEHEMKLINEAGGMSFVINETSVGSLQGYLSLIKPII
jgi:Holliday junction resolvase